MTEAKVKQEMLRVADELSGIDLQDMSPAERKIAGIAFRALGFESVPELAGVVMRPRHPYAELSTPDCERCGHPRNHWMHDKDTSLRKAAS